MQTITDTIYLHPFAVELPILLASFGLSLFLSLKAGKKLFMAFAGKNRTASLVGAFIWYILLFVYFSGAFFVLPDSILLILGIPRHDIDGLYFATGNYFLTLFFVFFALGAIAFFVFTKKRAAPPISTDNISFVRLLWIGTRKAILVALLVFVVVGVSRMPTRQDKKLTEETIQKINSQKITLADVMGEKLPPQPDSAANNSTLAGIDVNNNGIRDDVELAIFKLHPDSARIRAAELQYAMALQMYLTDVFNSETLVAVIQQDERGSFCIGDTVQKPDSSASDEIWNKFFAVQENLNKEVENFVLDTERRKRKYEDVFKKYMTSYATNNKNHCDVVLSNLPN